MLNPTPTLLTDVTVNDATPAYTALAGPVATPVQLFPGYTCSLTVPSTGNVAGYEGPLEWTCPGEFPANGEASLSFNVQISP